MTMTCHFLTVINCALPETHFSVEQNGRIKFPLYFTYFIVTIDFSPSDPNRLNVKAIWPLFSSDFYLQNLKTMNSVLPKGKLNFIFCYVS